MRWRQIGHQVVPIQLFQSHRNSGEKLKKVHLPKSTFLHFSAKSAKTTQAAKEEV